MSYDSGKPFRSMIPRRFNSALGYKNPSVVINSTRLSGSILFSKILISRAMVLFPTATEPAIPIIYGMRIVERCKKFAFCICHSKKFW